MRPSGDLHALCYPPRPAGLVGLAPLEEAAMSLGGIVNLDGRGMLVVSVARRLGSEVRLLAYYAARFKPSGAAKGALGPLS